MRRCSGPSAKGEVGLFLSTRQGAEPPTPAHTHIAIANRDFRTSGETARNAALITSSPRDHQRRSPRCPSSSLPQSRRPDDGIPDDDGDQAGEAGLDEDDVI
jgi:hypothetical protein